MADAKEPGKAWVVVFAGTTINLCLGCLYAWSVWLKYLTDADFMATQGWPAALTAEQAANPASLCMLIFGLMMFPGGRIQDKMGPKVAAAVSAAGMAAGLLIAGLAKSYAGIMWGFGFLGGVGMGVGYAAPTPAALKWFGPHRRGLIAGLVVSGYGGAAFYVAPLARWLITSYGISTSFVVLGIAYGIIIFGAGMLLSWPGPDYVVPIPEEVKAKMAEAGAKATAIDWAPSEILKTWQCYALIALFCLNTQAGILIIGHAAKMVKPMLASGYIIVAFGGALNAMGRIGTGKYSDIIGRDRAYMLNAAAACVCMFALPAIISAKSLGVAFVAIGIAYWVYGGGLSLMPSYTGDFFGLKNFGMNYAIVFVGWALGAFMPKLGGRIRDVTGSYDWAFYIAGILLIVAILIALVTKRPEYKKA
ncbi:MAG: OFA family MFS transporter [Syntrophobacterales bacterium]|jgi:MFS family permease